MDFINLDAVLAALADCVPWRQDDDYAEAAKASEAAGLLRQVLKNVSQGRPRWVALNKISKKPEFNDAAVFPEGMAMLDHTAGWYDREVKNRNNHFSSCLNAGLDPNVVAPMSTDLNDGKYPRVPFLRQYEIGFDRGELVTFLDDNGIDHNLKHESVPVVAAPGFQSGELVNKTEDILRAEYTRVDSLAWALASNARGTDEPDEAHHRRVRGWQDWIRALGLPCRDSTGAPSTPPKGTAVAGMDVREFDYVRVADVQEKAQLESMPWPDISNSVQASVAAHSQASSTAQDTAPSPAPVVAGSALDALPMKKSALVRKHAHHWPTIEADISGASENGLSAAAKAGQRGWGEERALAWARARGKLIENQQAGALTNSIFSLPGRRHSISD